jgi:hypothetical protein
MMKADITIILVPEAKDKSKRHLEMEIAKSLRCDWLLKVEKVAVSNHSILSNKKAIHHRMPNGKEVKTNG